MKKAIVAVIAGVVVAVIVSGCQQHKTRVPNEKQARLLAAQSADLQKELAVCQAEIEALRERHAQELQERDTELARCKARIEALQKDLETGIGERVAGVTTKLMYENARLRQEVEQLKTQIAGSSDGNVP